MDALVKKVTQKIAKAIRPDKIILFGSRANGTANEKSDIDLVMVYSGQKTNRNIELEIEKLFLYRDFSMDVIVMRPEDLERKKRIANTLAREITERGVVCYGQR
jgi:predicted nucleotidyltransferase